jgi:hypothetical protein
VKLDDGASNLQNSNQNLTKLRKEHSKIVEELAVAENDRTRFKDLSESYMQEVARLEAQLEAVDIKPKAKGTQRPKDTVKREHSATNNSN